MNLIFLFLVFVGLYCVLYAISPTSKPKSEKSFKYPFLQEGPIPEHFSQKVHPDTKKRLYSMMAGDVAAAERLVWAVMAKHDQTAQWCWMQTIHELERDRR